MNFYTYSAPGSAEDRARTLEAHKDYAAVGLNVLMLTGKNGYDGDGWEQSNAKKCFDYAKEAGIERIILDDHRIMGLIQQNISLVGEGNRFANEQALDDYIASCMQDYKDEPLFYGLRLRDEPTMPFLTSFAEVYRSVKRVGKRLGISDSLYMHINLLPYVGDFPLGVTDEQAQGPAAKYEYYLEAFARETGADRMSIDNYPFRPRNLGGIFLMGYFICFQIFRRVCDKYGMEMSFVMQSFEMIHKTKEYATAGYRRITTVNEMMLQMNAALGFGVRDVSFYTYVTMNSADANERSNYRSSDGSSFITREGEKTRLYGFAKTAIAHAKALEETLFAYDFKGANLSVHETAPEECKGLYLGGAEFTTLGGTTKGGAFDNSYRFKSLKSLSHDSDILLATEFKNGKGGHMLMIENVLDVVYKTTLTPMQARVDFGSAKKIKVFRRGAWTELELTTGIYEVELAVGEAVYILV